MGKRLQELQFWQGIALFGSCRRGGIENNGGFGGGIAGGEQVAGEVGDEAIIGVTGRELADEGIEVRELVGNGEQQARSQNFPGALHGFRAEGKLKNRLIIAVGAEGENQGKLSRQNQAKLLAGEGIDGKKGIFDGLRLARWGGRFGGGELKLSREEGAEGFEGKGAAVEAGSDRPLAEDGGGSGENQALQRRFWGGAGEGVQEALEGGDRATPLTFRATLGFSRIGGNRPSAIFSAL